MKRTYLTSLLLVCIVTGFSQARSITLSLDPDNVVSEIDNKIYGHFLEHIFHSVNGGLFGEYTHVTSTNDGPINFLLDSSRLF